MTKFISRILIVGYGSIAKRHLHIARSLYPSADIRVLRHRLDRDIPKSSNGCFFSIHDAVEFEPNLAVIANPATFHLEVARAMADVGAHLLIEKPIAVSLDGVQELIELCIEKSVVLMVGYNLRFLDSLLKYRDIIHRGLVGKILSIRCEVGQYLPTWRPESDYRESVSARLDLGGGALLELSHEIDYIQWIFGCIDWVRASMHKKSSLEINVEDLVHIIFESYPDFQDSPIVGTINLDFIRHDKTRSCIAIGENGSIRWNGLTGVIDIFESHSNEWREILMPISQPIDAYNSEWHHLIEEIGKDRKDYEPGKDSLKVMRVIEAVRKSNADGGAICKTCNI